MKKAAAVVVFALALSLTFSWFAISAFAAEANEQAAPIWITNVNLLSPDDLDHTGKGSVLIENGRIVRVEHKASASAPKGASMIDGHGGYLIPGLIDSHVHLASVPGMSFEQMPAKPELTAHYYEQLPRSYLYYGYTTLVDLAVFDRKVLEDFRQAPLHPDLYDCGEPLVLANGYPMAYLPAEARFKFFPNFIYDPAQASSIPSEYKAEDHTPAADVARVKASGGICVKTFYEHGFGRMHDLPVMSPEIFAQVRKAASENGLLLMMHANAFEAQKFGVDNGTDVLAHGMWNWGELNDKSGIPPEITKVLDEIVKKKIGYQATIQVLVGEQMYFDPEFLKQEADRKVVPADLLAWYATPEGQSFKKEMDADNTPDKEMYDGYENGPIRRVRQAVGYLAAKDANFLFGTDTPSGPIYGNLPGLNGYQEMQQLKKAGLSLAQIFKAATINNAREFKLDSQVGTIAPGKVANLLLLSKSPLESVDAYDSIVTVWIHGQAVARESLAANLVK